MDIRQVYLLFRPAQQVPQINPLSTLHQRPLFNRPIPLDNRRRLASPLFGPLRPGAHAHPAECRPVCPRFLTFCVLPEFPIGVICRASSCASTGARRGSHDSMPVRLRIPPPSPPPTSGQSWRSGPMYLSVSVLVRFCRADAGERCGRGYGRSSGRA